MFRRALFLLFTLNLTAFPADAADISGYLVGTTDYVYRGVTQSDGHGALQLGLDVSFDSGVFLGAWASTVDIEGPADHNRQNELRAYLGYGFDINRHLRLVINTVAYRYPGEEGRVAYNNQETSVSLGIAERFWIEYAYSPNLYTTSVDTHNVELFSEWMLGNAYLLSAGIGHYRVDRPATNTANNSLYWQAGITRSFSAFDIDIRYHEADEAVWFTSSADRIGSRVAFSVRFGF